VKTAIWHRKSVTSDKPLRRLVGARARKFSPANKKQARMRCRTRRNVNPNRRKVMLWTIFVILLVLWLLGLIGGYAFGGFIHILLVLAVVVLIINLVSGRRGV
jgi:hypothetical protein